MMTPIGTCSICGGQVLAHIGGWMGIMPLPPPTCQQCGATSATFTPRVIPMVPASPREPIKHPDPENADLLAALGHDIPEYLRFRNGLAPWERPGCAPASEWTLDDEMQEHLRRRMSPQIVIA